MDIKTILYSTPFRRTASRFLEIFILSGFMGLIGSVEFENTLIMSFGTGLSAMLLKMLREMTNDRILPQANVTSPYSKLSDTETI